MNKSFHANMYGGSLTRYHPPMTGRGLKEDLFKAIGPIVLESTQSALNDLKGGMSLGDVSQGMLNNIKRGVKRKAVPIAGQLVKGAVQRKVKKAKTRVKNIFWT